MYNKFFGFKEKPFRLVPNPEYLFLSKSHEEALAHLGYAISHGDGFVEITGEVGTGKTTLCRVFLENLDTSIEAAYIFNPKLDALQLLKAINDELGIDSRPDNTKDLIDTLNAFLIEKKAAGKKVLVLIDEAQNLSLEVLEQLRLLSNLETTREKLLQIILVGQPELGDMLSSHQLRQLGQRITINCQLRPLTFSETKDYIRHRIALASHRAGPPFDNASYRAIFEYSRGIPRLINIACDRTLLNAFSRNSFKITGTITKEAIVELRSKKSKTSPWQQMPAFIAITAVVVSLLAVLLYFNTVGNSESSTDSRGYSLPDTSRIAMELPPPAKQLSADAASSAPEFQGAEIAGSHDRGIEAESQGPDQPSATAADIPAESAVQLESRVVSPEMNSSRADTAPFSRQEEGSYSTEILTVSVAGTAPVTSFTVLDPADSDAAADAFLLFLKSLNSRHSRNSAMLQALNRWSQSASTGNEILLIDSDSAFFREAAAKNNLLVQPIATDADLGLIQTLNLPAILTFYLPYHTWPKYLTIAGIDAEKTYLDAGDQGGIIAVDRKILLRFWSGEAYIVWKNFNDLEGIITEHSPADAVLALKRLLQDLAYLDNAGNARFEADLKQLIRDIQIRNGLDADGMVGPLTKIALYNASPAFIKPSLGKFVSPEINSPPTDILSETK